MFRVNMTILITILFMLSMVGIIGCSDESVIGPASFPINPVVFSDAIENSVDYQAFGDSKLDAFQIDEEVTKSGSHSIIITVPDSNSYAGGALVVGVARDLSSFNALTFWAKASIPASLDVVGFGNDNSGNSKYTAEANNLELTTSWQKYIIPIPLSEKLGTEKGLFYFAEAPENGVGNSIWFDEIIFEKITTITNIEPIIATQTLDVEVGEMIVPQGGFVKFDLNDISVNYTEITVSAMAGYFTFLSSDNSIVTANASGNLVALKEGTATLNAKLGATDATGEITVDVTGELAVPTISAPTPTVDAASVISLFSDAYSDVNVNSWSATWDVADYEDYAIGSDNVKKYFNLPYAGIDFSDPSIDISTMTYFHIDVWTPYSTDAPSQFTVKLVDFGADGIFNEGSGDDTEDELAFGHNNLSTGTWVSIEIPLVNFIGLTSKQNLSQIIIAGNLETVYIDNIYFHSGDIQTAPQVPAPTPTADAADVVSLYSDAYTNSSVDTWSANWDNANVEDFAIGADSIKKYSSLTFAGIEFYRTETVDASALTHFHMDVWTPDLIDASSNINIKLVDLGPDGLYGGGDDVEHEIILPPYSIMTGFWASIDIAISDFAGLTTTGHIGQMIITSDPNTLFIDNIYFYDSGIPTIPITSAPTPTLDAADVISLFSDAYTDITVDTWSTPWDSAFVEEYTIGTDNVKKYSNLLFAGIEFTTSTIDATTMTHFHMDVWTPDPTNFPATFEIKIVDFGANGVWDGGGDDVEHEIILDEDTMNSNSWVSIELALADFTNLVTKGHLAQLIITADPNTVYVDNVYFHK